MVNMNDLSVVLPELILAIGAILVMLMIAFKRNHLMSNLLTLATFVVAFTVLVTQNHDQELVGNLFIVDALGRFLSGLILAGAIVITLMSFPYFHIQKVVKEEYYILLVIATLGAVCMTISNHLIMFALSLEVLSVSLFALIGYMKEEKAGIEAGIKYLLMAATASAFLLFGFALIYTATGSMDLQSLGSQLSGGPLNVLVLAGLAMAIVGFGFKMALVPFHMWTPDIYAAASSPASAFVATISKGAAFVFLLRLFYVVGGLSHPGIWWAFALIAIASMFIGNWLGLRQENIKRLIAYSSISHLGYLMVGFLAFSDYGIRATSFYLVIYFASILAAFCVIIYLTNKKGEPVMLEDYRGLFWKKPWLAAFFTLVMLSLAGVPFTAGFMGKFYVLSSGMDAHKLVMLFALVISSTIGLFYYLKVVAVMASKGEVHFSEYIGQQSWVLKALVVALFIIILWLGVFPSTFFNMMGM